MRDAAVFTSFLINIGFCILAIVHLKKQYKQKKLKRWEAFALYTISALLSAFLAGFGIFSTLVGFYEGIGFNQELGHHAAILISITHLLVSIVSIPVGILVINKKVGVN